MNSASLPAKILLWILWFALAGFGAIGIYQRFALGHELAAYGSYVPWGLWVSAYIYFSGMSAGAFLLSAIIYVFKIKRLERVAKVSIFVALIMLLMGLLIVFFDLGREWRFYYVFASPSFTSMMAWMVWLYNAYFILLLVALWLALRPELAAMQAAAGLKGRVARLLAFSKQPLTAAQEKNGRDWLRVLCGFGIVLAIVFPGGVGSLFGTVGAHPYWHTPLMPILFLTGALVSGAAIMMFVFAAFWPRRDEAYHETLQLLGKAVIALLVLDLVLEWAEFSIPMWYGIGHEYDLMMKILFGDFWFVFWVFHILLGCVVPVALLLGTRRKPWAYALAGFLVASMFLAVRLNLVIPAFVDPHLAELENAFQDERLSFTYLPSMFEWQVIVGVVAIGIAAFYVGRKLLPLLNHERAST